MNDILENQHVPIPDIDLGCIGQLYNFPAFAGTLGNIDELEIHRPGETAGQICKEKSRPIEDPDEHQRLVDVILGDHGCYFADTLLDLVTVIDDS